MTDAPDGKMVCQLCHGGGKYTQTYLVGDGQPGIKTEVRSETVKCTCDSGFVEDPEASRKT